MFFRPVKRLLPRSSFLLLGNICARAARLAVPAGVHRIWGGNRAGVPPKKTRRTANQSIPRRCGTPSLHLHQDFSEFTD